MPFLRNISSRLLSVSLLTGMLLLCSSFALPSREYQIKAVFLFNFTQFVEWPSSAFTKSTDPLIIGVLGKDPFGSYIDQTVSGEKINNHPIIVKRYKSAEEISNCHLLYINLPDAAQRANVIYRLKGKSVLTVSDASNFMEQGGMIRFFTVNNKIQFQINPEAAKASGLTISSKLLRLAKIFVPSKK